MTLVCNGLPRRDSLCRAGDKWHTAEQCGLAAKDIENDFQLLLRAHG
jgi:hypothetical protein